MRTTKDREILTLTRLETYVNEYITLEQEKLKYARHKVWERDMDRTAVHTLYLMQERLDTVVQQIIKLVNRCMENDYDLTNEVAIEVYNYYTPLIRRGLFSFK